MNAAGLLIAALVALLVSAWRWWHPPRCDGRSSRCVVLGLLLGLASVRHLVDLVARTPGPRHRRAG
jgi:hypothetical protein